MPNFAPFLLALLLIAVFFRIDFFFTVVYFLFGSYLISRLWIGRAAGQVQVDRAFADEAFLGDEVPVDLQVRNTGRLPVPWLHLRESVAAQLAAGIMPAEVLSLGGHEEWRTRYLLKCRQRGYYTIGPLETEVGDLLGVTRRRTVWASPRSLTVYPRVVPLARLGLPTHSPLVTQPAGSPLFEDPSRLRGVRDYQRGDAPRRIHWPASAHTGRLVVKQYQPAIARETVICLDLDGENYSHYRRYEATELAIVVAASLATHMVMHEALPVGLATEALDPATGECRRILVPARSDRAHLRANILATLGRVQVTAGLSLAEMLRRTSVRLAWGATLVLVTGQADPAVFAALAYLQQKGLPVAVILVRPSEPAAGSPGASGRVRIHHIWTEADLEGGL